MPIPGKRVGEVTEFDFEFFANSKVMDFKAKPLEGHLTEEENFHIQSRISQTSTRGVK
jgi:hypothetical protein